MPNIDPNDRYPARNLPGDAEPWGRRVENDQVALKEGYIATQQSLSASNRGTAAQLAGFADQLSNLQELALGQVTFGSSHAGVYSDIDGPFDLSAAGETWIVGTTLRVPDTFTRGFFSARGEMSLVSPNTSVSAIAGRMYLTVNDEDYWSARLYQSVLADASVAVYPSYQGQFSDLEPGSIVTAWLSAITTIDWPASEGLAEITLQGTFSRT